MFHFTQSLELYIKARICICISLYICICICICIFVCTWKVHNVVFVFVFLSVHENMMLYFLFVFLSVLENMMVKGKKRCSGSAWGKWVMSGDNPVWIFKPISCMYLCLCIFKFYCVYVFWKLCMFGGSGGGREVLEGNGSWLETIQSTIHRWSLKAIPGEETFVKAKKDKNYKLEKRKNKIKNIHRCNYCYPQVKSRSNSGRRNIWKRQKGTNYQRLQEFETVILS